ncbi:hypothetical protein HPB52_003479 [Rhipicephalus sanguineus]|uniref:Uncharacterized protein n=1 Tax=Rhipicephalus sanguineus TaxID=34632 RepID=A0A9D4Q8U3_RHISA|nr:hypothetical protein HPB52_003479 [Rhipicephalus sanguineus]
MGAVRAILGLPKCSPMAATLAEVGEWSLTLRMLQRALGHIDRLHRATDGRALLERFRSQPGSRMGGSQPAVPLDPAARHTPPPPKGSLMNVNSLRRRKADLSEPLLQSDYDVLTLQELVRVTSPASETWDPPAASRDLQPWNSCLVVVLCLTLMHLFDAPGACVLWPNNTAIGNDSQAQQLECKKERDSEQPNHERGRV